MSNEYYDHTTYPTPNSPGSSAALRAELDQIEAGFNKLPTLSGNASKAVVVNSGATALEATSTLTGLTFSSPTISGGTINNAVIGGTTPAAGTFTALATTSATVGGLNVATDSGTQTLTNKTFNLANNTFVGTSAQLAAAITDESGTGPLLFANSPAMTGTPTAPTAAAGTSTTQVATTAFVSAAAFSAALPGQTGNAGKFVTTDGTNASWADVLPSQTSNSGKFLTTNGTAASWSAISGQGGTTASGSVTLTASSAGAQSITPTTWGQSVTLPDATTCTLAAQLFSISNAGDYDLKILNAAGACIGFARPFTTVDIGLADKATSAGTWTLDGAEIIGVTANNAITSSFQGTPNLKYISLDSSRDLLIFASASGTGVFGIVYNKSTQTWGSSTLIRSTAYFNCWQAIKTATDQAIFVSTNNGTALQAVVLSISGTTITVNTAATATVSANPGGMTWNSNFITIVGSSIVINIPTSTPSNVIVAMTISGTTVTIGSETTLAGNTNNFGQYLYTASSTVLLTLSQSTGTITARAYTISGTTITAGNSATLTTTATNGTSAYPFGSAWALVYVNSSLFGAILTISGTTPTFSSASITSNISGSVFVGTSKVVIGVTNGSSSVAVNTFSNNAGAISVGTQVTLTTNLTSSIGSFWAISSTLIGAVLTSTGSVGPRTYTIDISGTSPVLTLVSQLPDSFGTSQSGFLYKTGYLAVKLADNTSAFSTYSVVNSSGVARQGQIMYASPAGSAVVSGSEQYVVGTNSYDAALGVGVIQRVEVAQ